MTSVTEPVSEYSFIAFIRLILEYIPNPLTVVILYRTQTMHLSAHAQSVNSVKKYIM